MKSYIDIQNVKYQFDLNKGYDLSIPLHSQEEQVKCFFAPDFEISPVRTNNFIGSIKEGGKVNYMNVKINPHGNGTHTECVSHVWPVELSINQCLNQFFFAAQLITITPELQKSGDRVINAQCIAQKLNRQINSKALIIRSLPNNANKLSRNYSGTNPPFFLEEAIELVNEYGVKHLLTDLPSVDPEEDGGALKAHKLFWGIPENIQKEKTITELIFVDNQIKDGLYLLNLQISSFELDTSPSKPVIYSLKHIS